MNRPASCRHGNRSPCARKAFVGQFAVLLLATNGMVRADTVLSGSALALRSSGAVSGTSATLGQNGYFGTYVKLDRPGPVTLTAVAGGAASGGVNPNLTFSIGDTSRSFAVTPGSNGSYTYTTPVVPAGTYFVRTQLDNHKTVLVGGLPVSAATTLTLQSLSVSSNATVLNAGTDANALAAADTYINHFRKGDATVKLLGATAGSQVRVQLKSNAFKLGASVSGGFSTSDNLLAANPAAGSDAANFQQFIDARFNSIVPSNAGKWDVNATVSPTNASTPTIGQGINDQMMAYAAAHGMAARQHNLIWGNQQPTQVKTWLANAANTSLSTTVRAQNLLNVKTAIANRIAYYISGTNTVDGKLRAANFQQLDVLNEALQTGNYYSVLGVSGVADVYQQAQAAIKAAGLKTTLYTNEYNVLQNSPTTITTSSTYGKQAAATYGDAYANWYRNEVEAINNAGLTNGAAGDVVTGIGVQYYPTASGTRGPAVIQSAMQNLSVAGLPISLTEFGGQTSITAAEAPKLVDDTLRMMMGTPSVDSMLIWGFYDDGTASTNPYGGGTVLVNKNWKNADGTYNLTAAGRRFEYLYGRGLDPTAPGANADGSNPNPWTTDFTLTVAPDGTIDFNGFYGTYTVTIDGKTYDLSLDKGANNAALTLAVPEPVGMAAVITAALAMGRRPSRGSAN